jgi:hypothetical protein
MLKSTSGQLAYTIECGTDVLAVTCSHCNYIWFCKYNILHTRGQVFWPNKVSVHLEINLPHLQKNKFPSSCLIVSLRAFCVQCSMWNVPCRDSPIPSANYRWPSYKPGDWIALKVELKKQTKTPESYHYRYIDPHFANQVGTNLKLKTGFVLLQTTFSSNLQPGSAASSSIIKPSIQDLKGAWTEGEA